MFKKLPMALTSFVVLCITIANPVSASQYSYTFDQNNRLSQITKDGVAYEDMIYDSNGNLVKVQKVSAVTVSDSSTTTNSVVLTWSSAPNATKYIISQNGTKIGESTTTSYTVSGLTSTTMTAYTFTVAAVYPSGATGQAGSFTPMVAPSNLRGTSTDTTVTLTWNAVTGASGYKVYTVGSSGAVVSSTSSATILNLTAGQSYSFNVVPYNAQGQGFASGLTIYTTSTSNSGGGGGGGGSTCGDIICASVVPVHKDMLADITSPNGMTHHSVNTHAEASMSAFSFTLFKQWISNLWTKHWL